MQDLVRIRRALLSVSDKTGIVELARALLTHGVEVLSTGGTAKLLQLSGLVVEELLKCPHAIGHFRVRGRHERRIARATASDPVLRTAEFTGLFMAATAF